MKKILLLSALMVWIGISANADPVKVGNLWYEILDAEAKTAEIVANPDGTPYANVRNTWFATSVEINGETYTVETVGEGAFEGASFSPYANSSGVATFYMIGLPMSVIKKDAFKDITSTDGNVTGMRFITNPVSGNVTGSSKLTYVAPGAFRGAHIRGFVSSGTGSNYKHNVAFTSDGAPVLYDNVNKEIIAATADLRADISMGTNGQYGSYATSCTFISEIVSVADYAFWGNSHIKTLNMNEGLTNIGQQAFHGMTALQTVNIPSTVTTLAVDAFEGCTAIANLTCSTTTPPTGVVFEDAVYARIAESGNITVPDEALEAYKADENWGRFWAASAPKMYIAGDFTNWQDGKLEMTESDGAYSITVNGITDGQEFKFIEGDGENAVWYGGNSETTPYYVHADWCTDIDLIVEGGVNFAVVGGGDLTFTISADKKLTVTGWPEPANELYLAGSMTDWQNGKEAMTLNAETGKFSITREMAAGAEFKFIDQEGAWIGGDADGNFVVNEAQVAEGVELSLLLNGGNNFQIPVAGTWTLTVDKSTMKLVISGEWPNPKYTVTVADGIENGTVEVDKAEAEEGETVTVTATPIDRSYLLKSITVTPETLDLLVEVDENGQFTMPADNVVVTAEFEPVPPVESEVTFTAAPANGTVAVYVNNEPIESGTAVAEGTQVMVVLTPAEGYKVATFTVETVDEQPAPGLRRARVPITDEGENTYSFQMPGEPITLNVEFIEDASTGISDLNAAAGQVTYVNVMGQTANRPFNGVNIVMQGGKAIGKLVIR